MRISRLALILTLAVACAAAMPADSQAELRFGPWVYWAPYYYPSPEKLRALGFRPEDFAPRYQSPNPLPPGAEGECLPPPPRRPTKVASRPLRSRIAQPQAPDTPRTTRRSVLPRRLRSAHREHPRALPQQRIRSVPPQRLQSALREHPQPVTPQPSQSQTQVNQRTVPPQRLQSALREHPRPVTPQPSQSRTQVNQRAVSAQIEPERQPTAEPAAAPPRFRWGRAKPHAVTSDPGEK